MRVKCSLWEIKHDYSHLPLLLLQVPWQHGTLKIVRQLKSSSGDRQPSGFQTPLQSLFWASLSHVRLLLLQTTSWVLSCLHLLFLASLLQQPGFLRRATHSLLLHTKPPQQVLPFVLQIPPPTLQVRGTHVFPSHRKLLQQLLLLRQNCPLELHVGSLSMHVPLLSHVKTSQQSRLAKHTWFISLQLGLKLFAHLPPSQVKAPQQSLFSPQICPCELQLLVLTHILEKESHLRSSQQLRSALQNSPLIAQVLRVHPSRVPSGLGMRILFTIWIIPFDALISISTKRGKFDSTLQVPRWAKGVLARHIVSLSPALSISMNLSSPLQESWL